MHPHLALDSPTQNTQESVLLRKVCVADNGKLNPNWLKLKGGICLLCNKMVQARLESRFNDMTKIWLLFPLLDIDPDCQAGSSLLPKMTVNISPGSFFIHIH